MRALCGLAMIVALGILGCGGNSGQSQISGKVTLDGKAIEQGSIDFVPVDGKGPTAGGLIKNGAYSLPVAPGPKNVSIKSPEVTGERDAYAGAPNSPKIKTVRERIPEKYNSQTELRYEVPTRSATQDFELKSN